MCLYAYLRRWWVPSKQHCVCKRAGSADIFISSVTALFALQDYNDNDVWQRKLVKNKKNKTIPHHFKGSHGLWGPPLLYKTFISPFNFSSNQRWLNNIYPGLHHLGHWFKLNQVFKPSPPSSSGLHHVRATCRPLHHLKYPWDFLINTAFKWSLSTPREKRWKVQPVSMEVAYFAFQDNSQQKLVTLCSLIAPHGMRRGNEKMRAKQGGWNKNEKWKDYIIRR